MKKFKNRYEDFRKINEEKEQGILRYIPLKDSYPKLSKYVAGIIPETSYLVSGSTGSAKSKFVRHYFIKSAYESIKNNGYDIELKIIINALEESVDDILDAFICQRIAEKHKIRVTRDILAGYTTEYISNEILDTYEQNVNYFSDLDKMLDITNIGNPTGFYKYVREEAYKNGTFWKNNVQINPKNEKGEWVNQYWSYKKNNQNHIILPITDHITLFGKETKYTVYDTIANFSKHYVRRGFNLMFKMPSVIVQQQNADSTERQFSNNGRLVTSRLIPTLANLDSVKITKNDALVIYGIFAPARFGVKTFEGYNLEELDDCFRTIHILKNRKGGGIGKVLPLFFDGLLETFEELPAPDQSLALAKFTEIANKIL